MEIDISNDDMDQKNIHIISSFVARLPHVRREVEEL